MDWIRSYMMKIVCAGLICSIIQSINPKGNGKEIRSILCGLFMICTVISPLKEVKLQNLADDLPPFRSEAMAAAQLGTDLARETYLTIINDQTKAYILDKAAQLELQIQVEVGLDPDSNSPESVIIRGNAGPYAKHQLIDYIHQTFGIRKERIKWIAS